MRISKEGKPRETPFGEGGKNELEFSITPSKIIEKLNDESLDMTGAEQIS